MNAPHLWAVVPVKAFRLAKQRLASSLQPAERAELARLMLRDVLAAVTASCDMHGAIVVTRDPEAVALARQCGAAVLTDEPAPGINAAVGTAIHHLARHERDAMLVVPADIPQITARAIAELARCATGTPAVAVVPAARDGGTNLLLCRPPQFIQPQFGPRSSRLHVAAARRAGIEPIVLPLPDIACDIDRPEDISAFLALQSPTLTHAFLSTLNLRAHAPARGHETATTP